MDDGYLIMKIKLPRMLLEAVYLSIYARKINHILYTVNLTVFFDFTQNILHRHLRHSAIVGRSVWWAWVKNATIKIRRMWWLWERNASQWRLRQWKYELKPVSSFVYKCNLIGDDQVDRSVTGELKQNWRLQVLWRRVGLVAWTDG